MDRGLKILKMKSRVINRLGNWKEIKTCQLGEVLSVIWYSRVCKVFNINVD